jgi:Flp pilus assembly pilin Flp
MEVKVNNFRRLVRNEDGAVAIEYSLIAGAMFLAISPAFYLVRDAIGVKFTDVIGYFASF